ncbi:hypothetical protein BGY98DRAFT_937751 [Russula aff. rugulosa BPL654]|nr:hypothetical protein BGY98DRAFT_937751 [Russula aff. rugulosa BPL654]
MKRILHKEVEAKDQQAADSNNRGERLIRQLGEQLIQELSTTVEETPEVPANVPSNVANNTDDDDSFSTRSSGWDEDHNEEYKTLWPTPPSTPPQGDDMHPPQIQISRPYPGQGWVLNTYGTTHYYWFLIPDPTTRRNVVAPYLSYSINRSKPRCLVPTEKVTLSIRVHSPLPTSTTYAVTGLWDGFVPWTGISWATGHCCLVRRGGDICPVITVDQQRLLNPEAPFADTVNHVINNYFPYDLAAAVCQYQYYRETQYAIQASIKSLREKEMRYMEHAIGTLSELENANES